MPDRNPLIRAVTSANGFTVREAIPSDADAIAGFNVAMALETEQRELDAETVRAEVQAVFDEPSRGTYVIAETRNGPDSPDNEVIGGLLITHEWSD